MSDSELEKAIDEVGRDKVFAFARSMGWNGYESPPKFVWWGIVATLRGLSITDPLPASEKTL